VVSVLLFTIGGVVQVSSRQAPPATANAQAGSGRAQPEPINFDDHVGWTQIFDGKTLNGWDGSPDVWHVEDGAIVGESSGHPSGTTNIIRHGGEPANFLCQPTVGGAWKLGTGSAANGAHLSLRLSLRHIESGWIPRQAPALHRFAILALASQTHSARAQ
jgi:hypothetical protein